MRIAHCPANDRSYEAYVMARLKRSLELAELTQDDAERSAHLRACRHYCELLGNAHLK